MRYWTPADIFYVNCPYCDYSIEFWKDEPFRLCRSCKKEVRNPRIDLGCAKWCKFGDQCLGRSANEQLAAAPVIEKLKALVEPLADYELFMEIERIASLLLTAEGGDPCRIKPGALLIGAVHNEADPGSAARGMLSKTILGSDEADEVVRLIRNALSDEKPASLDAAILRDALVLAQPGLDTPEDFKRLTTEGAQMIFNLRQKKA
jgi:hypothetical protein